MELLEFAREYLTDQKEATKKLVTLFLNLVMEYELEQRQVPPGTRAPRIVLLIEMENGVEVSKKNGDLVHLVI